MGAYSVHRDGKTEGHSNLYTEMVCIPSGTCNNPDLLIGQSRCSYLLIDTCILLVRLVVIDVASFSSRRLMVSV